MSFFHYTSLEGIKGIVENKEMWGTHINFLNDQKEFDYLDSILYEAINELELPFHFGNEIHKNHKDILKDIKPSDRKRIDALGFIISFSQTPDCKSQWMEYCPQFSGYALEFSESPLLLDDNNISPDLHTGFDSHELQQCIYERRSQIEKIKSVILNINKPDKKQSHILSDVVDLLSDLKYRFKHHGFLEEKECRWYGRGDSQMEMRVSKGIMVPYVKVPIDISKLSAIWVGPSPVQDKAVEGVSYWWSVLQRADHTYIFKNEKTGIISIRKSEIPYSFI
ncbi:MAG: DUF2971 domain-containing protein [Colwellia sp.]|nr:DUF2971 domain-containing protein [Colwellia sp.]